MKINEIFGPTIQGEGPFIGMPAIFIRTHGCIAPFCSFCDTPYTWNGKEKGLEMTISEIVKKIKSLSQETKLIVITGGEPFMQEEVYTLANVLAHKKYYVQFETSGKAKINKENFKSLENISIVMSPKVYNEYFVVDGAKTVQSADYYKFVVSTNYDVKLVNKFVKDFSLDNQDVYLMPLGKTRKEQLHNLPYIADLCIENNYNLSARLHTLIWDKKRKV